MITERKNYVCWLAVLLLAVLSVGCVDDSIERQLLLLQSAPIDLSRDGMLTFDHSGTGEEYFSEEGKMKMVVYTGPNECTPCNLKTMSRWYELQDSIKRQYGSVVKYYFIFSPQKSQVEELEYNLQETICDQPLLLDTAGCFLKRNINIPANPSTHTFLVDSCNNVILVGSPVKNPRIRNLLFQVLDSNLQKTNIREASENPNEQSRSKFNNIHLK